MSVLYFFYNDYLKLENISDVRKMKNRKYVRCIIFFIMCQYCLIPNLHFMWLHSLMIYKFLIDLKTFLQKWGDSSLSTDNNSNTNEPAFRIKLTIAIIIKAVFSLSVLIYNIFFLNTTYLITTWLYFLIINSYLDKILLTLAEKLQIEKLEGLEECFIKVFLGFLEIVITFVFLLWCLMSKMQLLMLVALYSNIYATVKDVVNPAISYFISEWMTIASYPKATVQELLDLDDVCAVCLCKMYVARKTNCNHFFHGKCLRNCIKQKPACPICNSQLLLPQEN